MQLLISFEIVISLLVLRSSAASSGIPMGSDPAPVSPTYSYIFMKVSR